MSTRRRPDLARRRGSRRRQATQAGFTLVELMVSLTISLVILAALVALFVNTNRSSREFERANSMIENGRLAVQVLENDVIHAGFWGTYVPEFDDQTLPPWVTPTDVPTVLPDPCLAYANWNDDVDGDGDPDQRKSLIGVPVQAYEDAVVCGGVIQNKVANTDILIVRHAEMCVPGVSANCEADVAGRLYFQDGRCTTDLVPYVFDTAGFTLLQRDCAAVADKRKFISNIYYVRDFAVTPGDGTPTLVRSQFDLSPAGDLEHLPAVPLIEGIERFRVELGIDAFRTATSCAAPRWHPAPWATS
jgi:type IV pilus assembly protein PilW